jgi:hypothetical protein
MRMLKMVILHHSDNLTIFLNLQSVRDKSGVSMGPISLSFDSDSVADDNLTDNELIEMVRQERKNYKSIHSMTTEEWRAKFEQDGAIDLWVEEEFNAGSRLKVCNSSDNHEQTWLALGMMMVQTDWFVSD